MVAGTSHQVDASNSQSEKIPKLLSNKRDKVQTLNALCMLYNT